MRLSIAIPLLLVGLSAATSVFISDSDPTPTPSAETGRTRTPRTARCPRPPTRRPVDHAAGGLPAMAPQSPEPLVPRTHRSRPSIAATGPAFIPVESLVHMSKKRSVSDAAAAAKPEPAAPEVKTTTLPLMVNINITYVTAKPESAVTEVKTTTLPQMDNNIREFVTTKLAPAVTEDPLPLEGAVNLSLFVTNTPVKPVPEFENPTSTPSILDREASITKITAVKPAPGPEPATAPPKVVPVPTAPPVPTIRALNVDESAVKPAPGPAAGSSAVPKPVPVSGGVVVVPASLDETNSVSNELLKTDPKPKPVPAAPVPGPGPVPKPSLDEVATLHNYQQEARAFYGKTLNHLMKGEFGEAFDLFAAKLERAFPEMLSKELLASLRASQNISEDKRAELKGEVMQQAQAYFNKKVLSLALNFEAAGFLSSTSTTFNDKASTPAPVLRPYLPAFAAARKQLEALSLSAKQALVKAFPHFGMLDELEAYIKVLDDIVVHLKGFCENLPGFEQCDQLRALY